MIRKLLATVGLVAASLAPMGGNTPPAGGVLVAPTKVLMVIEENHSFSQMKNQMPYLFSLSQRYGYATLYFGVTHPSEPNYIAIAGGSTFGITDDQPPSTNAPKVGSAKSILDQALNRGKTAKSYLESMGRNCQLTGFSSYAVKHNPWAFFAASRSRCNSFDVPASSFLSDAANNRLPNAGMLVPNLCNDAHNCSLAVADDWLRQRLPTVLASSDFTSGRLTVIVTADEDNHSAGNNVLTSVLNASLDGKVVTARLNHYSLCGYYSHVLGAPLLKQSTTGFAAAFGI